LKNLCSASGGSLVSNTGLPDASEAQLPVPAAVSSNTPWIIPTKTCGDGIRQKSGQLEVREDSPISNFQRRHKYTGLLGCRPGTT